MAACRLKLQHVDAQLCFSRLQLQKYQQDCKLLQLKAQAGRDESVLRRSWRLLSSTVQLAISRAELDGVTYVGGRAVRQVKHCKLF